MPPRLSGIPLGLAPPCTNADCGVSGSPIEALSDVRRPDARRAQIKRPCGVKRAFQVSRYSIVPGEGSLASNLLPKDLTRETLADEPEPCGPEMARISLARSFTCVAKGLAGAGTSPDGPIRWPTSHGQGKGPSADAGEEVALRVASEVSGSNV